MPLWVQEAIGTFGYLAVFLLVAVEGLGIPVPGETALLVAAALSGAARGSLDIRAVIAVAALGAIAGDSGGYYLGRRWGRALIDRWGPRVGLTAGRVAIVERFFARFGVLAVFLGRYQAIFRTYIGMIAGMAGMPFRVFFPVRLASCVVWALIFGLVAFYLGEEWTLVQRVLHTLSVASVGVGVAGVVVAGAIFLWRRPRVAKATR